MSQTQGIRHLYRLFADILDYPTLELPEQARACEALLSLVHAEAAGSLKAFLAFVEQTPPARWEEIYTSTFDLQVVCYPYVGYQLFGDSYKRGAFLAKLNEEYRALGFSAEDELPDYLAVVLRFLAILEDGEVERDLIAACLVPALDRMQQAFQGTTNPYGEVIRALSLVFRGNALRDACSLKRVNGRQQG